MPHSEDHTAEELAMEVVIARTSSIREGLEIYMKLIDFVGIERAGQLTKQAQEILSMVIPEDKPK